MKLYYIATPDLGRECFSMLSHVSLGKYIREAYSHEANPWPLRRNSPDEIFLKQADAEQQDFFDKFCSLNAHLKEIPGALLKAYQIFTQQFRDKVELDAGKMR